MHSTGLDAFAVGLMSLELQRGAPLGNSSQTLRLEGFFDAEKAICTILVVTIKRLAFKTEVSAEYWLPLTRSIHAA